MPQPVRRACHFNLNGLQERPQHAAMLGVIVAISGRLESALGYLMALFSRGSAAITISMFHAVSSTDAQREMLIAAAEKSLVGPELDAFKELMEDFRPRYGERSKLVHNLWGVSNDHPDKALWCRSADAASVIAKLSAAKDGAAALQVTIDENLSLKCMIYTVKDLQDVAQRLGEYLDRVNAFATELMGNHPALVEAASAATSAQPTSAQSQLDLPQHPQTENK